MNRVIKSIFFLIFFFQFFALLGQSNLDYFLKTSDLMENGKYEDAISLLTEALRKYPDSGFFFRERGDCKYELKDFRGAILDYTKSIDLSPSKGDLKAETFKMRAMY